MMDGLVQDVLESRKTSFQHAYDSPYDILMGFLHAVDWKNETWLQVILAGHVLLWIVVVLTRKWAIFQGVIFVTLCALVYCAEWINTYCREHWSEFSTQNYFDPSGFFAGIVFAGPLLMVMFFQMLNSVYEASAMLIQAKRAELRAKHQRESKKEK